MDSGANKNVDISVALEKLGRGSKLVWTVFFFTVLSTFFSALHTVSYIFTAEIPEYACSIPELRSANWSASEIKNISTASGSCKKYNYNYTYLADLSFEDALEQTKPLQSKLEVITCSTFTFGDSKWLTIVEEWDLVCEKEIYRANSYLVFVLGKLVSSGIFGILADTYGRKRSIIIGVLMQIIAGPLCAIVPWFWAFLTLRFIIGMSLTAIQFSSLTILTEISTSKYKRWLGVAFNVGYSIGTIIVAGIAYYLPHWRHLQLAISISAIVMVFYTYFIPESPKWLLTQNRFEEAKTMVEKYTKLKISQIDLQKDESEKIGDNYSKNSLENLNILFSSSKLRKRLFSMNFSWFISSMTSFVLVLNIDNYKSNRYLYVLMMGITEMPTYFVASIILIFMGRRKSTVILYLITCVCLLSIVAVPHDHKVLIVGITLAGRFALNAVSSIIILITSDLFPTEVRNSAVGTSSLMAQIGSLAAPYVVYLLGKVAWWAPTTLCGILAFATGILSIMIPESEDTNSETNLEEKVAI